MKFARRIACHEARSLAWYGDLASEHNIAVLKIVRQCLLFPDNEPSCIIVYHHSLKLDSPNDERGSGITSIFQFLELN